MPKSISNPHNHYLRHTFEQGRLVRYKRGEFILRADDEPQGIFYIVRGYIKIYSINNRGDEYIHIIYGPGEVFPLALLLGPLTSPVYCQTVSDAELLRLPNNVLSDLIDTDSQLTKALLLQVVNQFRYYGNRVDNLEYTYARERVIYRLLSLASRFGKKQTDGSYVLPVPTTQQSLASSVNLSRESVNREFDRLVRLGLISYKNKYITLHDLPKLGKEFKGAYSPQWAHLVTEQE